MSNKLHAKYHGPAISCQREQIRRPKQIISVRVSLELHGIIEFILDKTFPDMLHYNKFRCSSKAYTNCTTFDPSDAAT
jgi:hypothetical protein